MRIFRPRYSGSTPYPRKGFLFTQEEGAAFANWIASDNLVFASWFSAEKSEIEKGLDCMIKIYDTMSRDLRELSNRRRKGSCLCGPTVYNYIHVRDGPFDLGGFIHSSLFPVPVATKLPIFQLTEVDDKIINRAKEGRYHASGVADKYIAPFVRM